MNKAVSWNINGVGFDARDAAREAARRQGKSLGEWLHEVIADNASERGLNERNLSSQDRIDAVTAKLERMSTRSAELDRRVGRDDSATERRPRHRSEVIDDNYADDEDEHVSEPPRKRSRRSSRAPLIEETEFLLEEAIDSMERRARRSERRTDDALASFARLLEANEARRDGERDAVNGLAKKLGDIESKLTDRLAANDQSPIKGALARLEARLDTIGRRSNAEAAAKQSALAVSDASAPDKDEPIQRLEAKLNSILDAVSNRAPQPQTSSFALATAQQAQALPQRRLGDAIAAISKRQRDLDDPSAATAPVIGLPRRRPGIEDLRRQTEGCEEPFFARREDALPPVFSAMQADIAALASKIEDMRGELVQRRPAQADKPAGLDSLRHEVAAMSQSLRDLAPRDNAIEKAIKALAGRIESSRDNGLDEAVLRPVENVVADLRHAVADMDPSRTVSALERELHLVTEKIDRLAETRAEHPSFAKLQDQVGEIRELLTKESRHPVVQDALSDQISSLVEALDWKDGRPGFERHLNATVDRLRDMVAEAPAPEALEKIEGRLEALAGKLDAALSQPQRVAVAAAPDAFDTSSLERLVRDLTGKLEAVQKPGADNRSFDALQKQIALLSRRFENSENGLAKLATLERSMTDLFAHLEATRASVETSAAHAAREVLRIAIDEGRGHQAQPSDREVATLQALQDEADARTHSTLNAVHETLEKIVDRMSMMEQDISDVRDGARPAAKGPAMAPPTAPASPPPAPKLAATKSSTKPTAASEAFDLGGADPLLRPIFKPERTSKTRQDSHEPTPLRVEEGGRSDFIAAARRAANAAQNDPAVAAFKRTVPAAAPADESRAGLMAKSRDYVASHKRPVLLSIGALFVLLGTLAIMQRTHLGASGPMMADRRPTAAVTRVAEGPSRFEAPASEPATRDMMSPSTLPKSNPPSSTTIAGSDPIQTGSIPPLPAFAAQGAGAPAPELPAALKAMAESGNSAAQFEMGSRYAEGRGAPRDLKQAARWYQKAADQGSAPAQYRLASLYEKGLGVAKDKAAAKGLYTKAAEAGNPRAMHNLAVLLADGDGKPDYEGAATWFRKAAQYGVHDSQFNLAILLARGLGVQQSLVQSYQWFAVAALDSDADAARKRDEVGDKLSSNDLAVAKALVAAFHAKQPNTAAIEVEAPPGGWDGAPASSHLNTARSKISSL